MPQRTIFVGNHGRRITTDHVIIIPHYSVEDIREWHDCCSQPLGWFIKFNGASQLISDHNFITLLHGSILFINCLSEQILCYRSFHLSSTGAGTQR